MLDSGSRTEPGGIMRAWLAWLTIALAGCAPEGPQSVSGALDDGAVPVGGLEGRAVASVGATGGQVTVDGFTLVFPEGALNGEVEITISSSDRTVSEEGRITKVFDVSPPGLPLLKPAVAAFTVPDSSEPLWTFWGADAEGFDRNLAKVDDATHVTRRVNTLASGFVGAASAQVFDLEEAPVDILVVLDNSCSMADHQAKLAKGFQEVWDGLIEMPFDWHLGVVSTDMYASSHKGKLRASGGARYVTKNLADGLNKFAEMLRLGTSGADQEKGFDAAYAALFDLKGTPIPENAGFVREDSSLYLLFVSDENDYSTIINGSDLQSALEDQWAARDLHVAAVITPAPFGCQGGGGINDGEPGRDYELLVGILGGDVHSICGTKWAEDALAGWDQFRATPCYALQGAHDPQALTVTGLPSGKTIDPSLWGYDADDTCVWLTAEALASTTDTSIEVR